MTTQPSIIARELCAHVWGMVANIGDSTQPENFCSKWSDLEPAQKKETLLLLVARGSVAPTFAKRARFSDYKNSVSAFDVYEEVLRHAKEARLMHTDRQSTFKESEPFARATS